MKHFSPILAGALCTLMSSCGDGAPTSNAGSMPPASTSAPSPAPTPASAPTQSGSGAEINRPHADDSAANRADSKDALTPIDQGESAADLRQTANIRKALVADATLSLDAHNIKIITNKGLVTLRGVVDSIDEHKRVNRIVQQTVGTEIFDDQLRVK